MFVAVMARNPLYHSLYNFKQKNESVFVEVPSLVVALFLWNTLAEFPRYLLLNLRYKSLISIDSQRPRETVFVVHLLTLHKILNFCSHQKRHLTLVNEMQLT